MFDNTTNIFLYNYEVYLDTIVKAVCEISIDIGKQLEEIIELRDEAQGFTIMDLFADDTLIEMSIRPEELQDRNVEGETIQGIGKEGLIAKVSAYFNEGITRLNEFESVLKTTQDILVLNRKNTCFLGFGDGGKEKLRTAIKKTKILKILVSKLKSERIQRSLEKLEIFENDIFYKNIINSEKLGGQPEAILIPAIFLNQDLLRRELIDENDIWINIPYYKKQDPGFESDNAISILRDHEGKEIGILTKTHIIPSVEINFSKYIKEDSLLEYYFLILEKSFTVPKRDHTDRNEPLVKRFIEVRKNPKLSQLLSYLKNNFYLDDEIEVDPVFSDFFNSVISFEQLDHLKGYHFLISKSIEHETALGVYSNEKKGTDYNLIHWLKHDGTDKIKHFRKLEPENRRKKIVSALKPSICYYFLEKYFEDLVENALRENGNKFFSNQKILIDNKEFSEIDFLIQSPGKIVYVEAKTKLTKFYIDGFLKRASFLLNKFEEITSHGSTIEFLLLGCYSDISVADYQYFINESLSTVRNDYNVQREGLRSIPYNFKVPIPDKEGKNIICVAESDFDKLKILLLEICPK